MKNIDMYNPGCANSGERVQELAYLRRLAEMSAAKVLRSDMQCLAIRHELEQKRRGFSLMAELAFTLGKGADYEGVFVAVSRRVNAALNMQRTIVLVPAEGDLFKPSVLQGYPIEEEGVVREERIRLEAALSDPKAPVLVTGADPADRLAAFRSALKLPFLISSPVILHNKVAGILVTGRAVEQPPWMPRLGHSDVETVQTVSAYLAAMLAGQRLLEAENRTRTMLDATPLCCNFWDAEFRNIDCNAEAARLFGLRDKQEYLARFRDLSPEYQPNGRLSSEMALEKITEAFTEGLCRFEWMHQKLSGEAIPAEITLVRVKHGDGYIVAGYTRDLRELKAMLAEIHKTEDDLRKARDLAEKSAKAKSEFLANMSHEIRTPMNAILGMTHLLGNTEMTEKQRAYVEKAEYSAKLLLRIINDILDFSKIDAGRLEVENIPLSVRKLIRTVHDIMIAEISKKSLKLRIAVDPDVPDFLLGDPLRLEQVLLNILSNAVKFTPQTGSIDIRLSVEAVSLGKVKVLTEISDTGIGMSVDQAERLFSPFTQADTSTTRKYGGTGLGLAISKSLVEMMGGEIWCTSRLGQGSTFSFTTSHLLAEESAPQVKNVVVDAEELVHETANADDDSEFQSIAGMRVLLAEDNEINQMIAVELLANKGVVVNVVGSGFEALEALEKNVYDLVLMDIQMPGMDGLTATKILREDPRYAKLPIIAMTAHAMLGDREISLDGGMDDHLTKPIDPQLLYAALKRWGGRALPQRQGRI